MVDLLETSSGLSCEQSEREQNSIGKGPFCAGGLPLHVHGRLVFHPLQQLQSSGGSLGQIWPVLCPQPSSESNQLLHHCLQPE